MYALTLTPDERRAIDWIGVRYRHGDELASLLIACSDTEWDSPHPITFTIPEHTAWEIADIIDTDNLACFSPALCINLLTLRDSVI